MSLMAQVRTLQIQGVAHETVVPTHVMIHVDVEVRDEALSAAKRTADSALDRVSQLVLQYQPDRTRIMTTAATHAPEYRHDRGQRLFTGYRSATSISVAIAIAEYAIGRTISGAGSCIFAVRRLSTFN